MSRRWWRGCGELGGKRSVDFQTGGYRISVELQDRFQGIAQHRSNHGRRPVAATQPDDLRWWAAERSHVGKIGVESDDRQLLPARIIPHIGIGRFGKPCAGGLVTVGKDIRQIAAKPKAEILVEKQPHASVVMIRRSRSAAKASAARILSSRSSGKSERISACVMPFEAENIGHGDACARDTGAAAALAGLLDNNTFVRRVHVDNIAWRRPGPTVRNSGSVDCSRESRIPPHTTASTSISTS